MAQDLDWLLGGLAPQRFLTHYFEKKPLHIRNRPGDYYKELFAPADLAAVLFQSEALLRRNVQTSRMYAGDPDRDAVAPSPTVPLSSWMRATLAQGESLLIQDFAQAWLPLGRLVRRLEAVLLGPVGASLFLSPAEARGFPVHFDVNDTMILQISGEKDWNLYRSSINLPVPGQRLLDAGERGEPLLRVRLQPGDLLYMPRGFIHETSTNRAESMHVTLIISPYRWVDLLHDLVDELAEANEALRRHVPLAACREIAAGGNPADSFGAAVAAALRRGVAQAAMAAPVTRHLTRFIDGLTPIGDALARPPANRIAATQKIARKEGMICQVHDSGDRAVIRFPGGHLRGPATIRAALRYIATAAEPFCLDDLPGPLSRRSKAVLVTRLIREGLLEPAVEPTPGKSG
jgi:ribosomal protein L16 Arg81 hydroxylase